MARKNKKMNYSIIRNGENVVIDSSHPMAFSFIQENSSEFGNFEAFYYGEKEFQEFVDELYPVYSGEGMLSQEMRSTFVQDKYNYDGIHIYADDKVVATILKLY